MLGAWENSRKAFIRSVCLSARNTLVPSGWIFMKFHIWLFFETLSRNFKIHFNLTKTGTLHEDQCTFFIISRTVFLRMKNVSDNICRGNQNTHFMFKTFFRKSCLLWGNVEKYCKAGQSTDDNMSHVHCMLDK